MAWNYERTWLNLLGEKCSFMNGKSERRGFEMIQNAWTNSNGKIARRPNNITPEAFYLEVVLYLLRNLPPDGSHWRALLQAFLCPVRSFLLVDGQLRSCRPYPCGRSKAERRTS